MKKIISIIGARPQFIKHAPVQLQLQERFNAITVHTGQHYDQNMSAIFFEQLQIPQPNYILDIVGLTKHGEQTAKMIVEIERILSEEKPDGILVYGDTNSTLAACIAAVKMQIPIIHIEAGLRSYNRSMPEEINRIVADEFSKLLFCPTTAAVQNLEQEGIRHDNIFITGDVMCDMLELVRPKIQRMVDFAYHFVTIHRPYNTDDPGRMKRLLDVLNNLDTRVVFAIHPRTRHKLIDYGVSFDQYHRITFIDPVGYIESLSYQMFADCIITDSGGMQKEAYMLKKKCITVRSETEWVETLEGGWNTLVFNDLETIAHELKKPITSEWKSLYGNGNAAEEIVKIIEEKLV